nr:SufD family Fe-S cluster assembly protein [Chloroflexaceae bacterium]
MNTHTLSELTSAKIAEMAQAAGEPTWLAERRAEAWELFAHSQPPQWRRTDLTGLNPEAIVPPSEAQGTLIQWDEALAAQGVVFTTLKAALKTHEALIREKMDTAVPWNEHKFSAMRAALWQDGVFLYVPRNVAVEVPLRVCYTLTDSNRAIFPRSLVVLEANASVTFIEEFTSHDHSESAVAGPVTELFAGQGSELRYISVQHWGDGVYHIGGQELVLGRDANSEWTSINLGAKVQHVEAEARLEGNGSRVNWLGVTFADKTQNLVVAPWLRHVGYNAESFMQFKTVVNGKGYSV